MRTATFSDFIRRPTQVLADAAGEDIRLTRRGEEDLVVSNATRHDGQIGVLDQLSRLIAASLDERTADRISGSMSDVLPWIEFLPDEHRRSFVGDYLRTARACASIGDFRKLSIEIEAWKETATAYAAGIDPAGADLNLLDEPVAVQRPVLT